MMKNTLTWGKATLEQNSRAQFDFPSEDISILFNLENDVLYYSIADKLRQTESSGFERVVGKVQDVFFLPSLPDRTLILKPKLGLSIMPMTTFKFYVYLPVTFQLYLGSAKQESLVLEHRLKNLSSSWFGEPDDGELCYALYSSFDTEMNPEKMRNDYIICPVEITNNSKEILDVKRLAVRGVHLNIYTNGEFLISNKVKIRYNGLDELSNVQFSKTVSSTIPNLKQIASARIVENDTVFKRSFQLIKHITQY